MNKGTVRHIVRFLVLLALQVLLFKSINLGISGLPHFTIFVYPIFVLVMPLRISKELTLIAAFVMGLLVDIWYNTPGIHAASLVFASYLRPFILKNLLDDSEIRQTMDRKSLNMKLTSYISYSLIFLVIHCFFYFLLEAFNLQDIGIVLVKTIFSTLFSFIFAFIYLLVTGYN